MKVLVTVLQVLLGFITLALLNRNHNVVGIDNLNEYYDPS